MIAWIRGRTEQEDLGEIPTQAANPKKANLKILFVCSVNRMRSATAQKIYEHDDRFQVMSAGTDKSARTVLTEEMLNWSDRVVVMENSHLQFIKMNFPEVSKNKRILCLHISDIYDYMQAELIEVIKTRVEDIYKRKLL
jgi:predicted protein tyrosine phosphatase